MSHTCKRQGVTMVACMLLRGHNAMSDVLAVCIGCVCRYRALDKLREYLLKGSSLSA